MSFPFIDRREKKMKSEVISFRYEADPTEIYTLKERMKADGVVSQVNIRFYPGCELALEVKPFILHKGRRAEDFFTYAEFSKSAISGDDDFFQFPVSLTFELDDEICVYFSNTDGINSYTVCVDVFVNYEAGGDESEI
jgi:hypothetical protein